MTNAACKVRHTTHDIQKNNFPKEEAFAFLLSSLPFPLFLPLFLSFLFKQDRQAVMSDEAKGESSQDEKKGLSLEDFGPWGEDENAPKRPACGEFFGRWRRCTCTPVSPNLKSRLFFFFPHRDQLVFFYAHFRSNHSRHLSQSPPSLTRSSTELSPSCHPCSGSQPNEVVLHLRNCKSVPSRMARPQALSQVQVGKACCRCGRSCAQKQRVSLKDEQNWELKSHRYKQSE